MNKKLLVGIKEIASFLKIHPRTLYRHLAEGKLPIKQDAMGRWTMCIDEYLESRTKPCDEE